MKRFSHQIVFTICLILGFGLLFLGACFFIDPLQAEANYGIHVNTGGNFSFHYIKGVRDIFCGLVILLLLWKKQFNI